MPQTPQSGFAGRCAGAQGIDATAYLTAIFKCLPTETNQTVHRLTPKAWAAEQTAKCHALAQSAIVAV